MSTSKLVPSKWADKLVSGNRADGNNWADELVPGN